MSDLTVTACRAPGMNLLGYMLMRRREALKES